MGLLDQVLGQVLGGGMGGGGMGGGGMGRGFPQAGPASGGGLAGGLGGLLGGNKGAIAMAILALLASKHVKTGAGNYGSILRDMMGGGPQRSGGGFPPSGAPAGGGAGGFGGALGGGVLGGMLGGGLGELLNRFQQNGHGDAMSSWIGSGPNQHLPPEELERAIGPEDIEELSRETGLPRDELLSGLSDALPQVVDGLTPNGRLPSDDEHATWV